MSRNAAAPPSRVSRPTVKRKLHSSPVAQKDGHVVPTMDRRVRRTRDALGDALVALMHEKPFNTITVQHVLDRAGVGRSTFYSHFRDKNDLFFSDAEDFFEGMSSLLARRGERSKRVAPVREFFAHVADFRRFYSALVASEKVRDVMELGQGYFARAIDQRLAALEPARSMPPVRRSALSHAFAGALFSLLNWWINHDTPLSAEQMDDLFHNMVCSGIHVPRRPQPFTPAKSFRINT